MDAGTALEAIEYGPFLDGACVVLAHSEPRRSNLAAPIDQSHPKLCCLFAQVSLVLLLVCASIFLLLVPKAFAKGSSGIRHARPAQIAVSIPACTQARTIARLRSIPAFAGRWNDGESSGIVEVQTHAFACTHNLHYAINVPSCSLLRASCLCAALLSRKSLHRRAVQLMQPRVRWAVLLAMCSQSLQPRLLVPTLHRGLSAQADDHHRQLYYHLQ